MQVGGERGKVPDRVRVPLKAHRRVHPLSTEWCGKDESQVLRPYQIERNTCPLEIALQVPRIFIPQWATPA